MGELDTLPVVFDEKLWHGTIDHVTVHALLPEGQEVPFGARITEISAGGFSAVEVGEAFKAVPLA